MIASDDYKLADKIFPVKLKGYLSGGGRYGKNFSEIPFDVKFHRGDNLMPFFELFPEDLECWVETDCNTML